MFKHLNILSTQMSTGLAVFFVMEGHAWLSQGFGIHPMAAGAMACALFLLPHTLRKWL